MLLFSLTACAPMAYLPGEKNQEAQLIEDKFVTEDGARLPVRAWLPKSETHAVIIALHGFNDYSQFFAPPGEYFSSRGIACFAYDQRGFGATEQRGLWAGSTTYANDLQLFSKLIKQRYPDKPLYLLGESMGGAIVITALSQYPMPEVAGVILAAPALWARSTMPWYQTSLLWTLAHSMPWLTLTGRGVRVLASDNIDMLRTMGRDPLVIKATRVDAIYGLTDLMDMAFTSVNSLHGHILMLYGENDQIIPKPPTYAFAQQLQATETVDKTIAFYPQAYHMLLRDLQANIAWKDIETWIVTHPDTLPSGADNHAKHVLSEQMSVDKMTD